MFFAIIWKNKQISLAELELIRPTKLQEVTNVLFTFDTDFPKLLNKLWGIIKRWEVIEHEQLAQELEWKKIIWTKDKDFWIKLKRQFNIKRFKLVDRIKTDLDVKNKWIEVIKFQDKIWIVRWYQNIKLYEKLILTNLLVVWKCEWCQQNLPTLCSTSDYKTTYSTDPINFINLIIFTNFWPSLTLLHDLEQADF